MQIASVNLARRSAEVFVHKVIKPTKPIECAHANVGLVSVMLLGRKSSEPAPFAGVLSDAKPTQHVVGSANVLFRHIWRVFLTGHVF